MKIAVSSIPRGYQFPGPDGNWLLDKHRAQIFAAAPGAQLVEISAHQLAEVEGIEVLLAEGGNRVHYGGELDWEDYRRFFTPSLRWVQLCSADFSDNLTPEIVAGTVVLTNAIRRRATDSYPSSSSDSGSSTSALSFTRNCTASRPSTIRWS